MRRLLCLVLIHDWHRMKWGGDLRPYPDADCRECRSCRRFEIYGYGNWHKARRIDFEPVREPLADQRVDPYTGASL